MGQLKNILSLIKFSHTIFALPFALSAMLVAAQGLPSGGQGLPSLRTFLLILICMVSGRTAAMAFNRYLDAELDAKNPRTAIREIPKGIIKKKTALSLAVYAGILFAIAAGFINTLCMLLSPFALFLLFFYSYTKRFTDFSHLFLGLALGLAPVGAWIAVTGSFALSPILLGLGVTLWVAGFDIIYATQDLEFDRKEGLHSLAVRFGIPKALIASRIFHLATLGCWFLFGFLIQAAWPFYLALSLCTFLIGYEHRLIKPNDFSKVNAAFFNMNGYISIVFLAGVVLSIF